MTGSDSSADIRKAPDRTPPALSPKRLAFVQCYADPDSETFGNATQSAMEAGYTQNYAAAAVTASRLLKNTKVKAYVDARMEDLEAGIQVGLTRLADIALGRERVRTVTVQENENGEVVARYITTSDIAAGIQLKALRTLSSLADEG